MSAAEISKEVIYIVVKNDEEQYSLWPSTKPVPPGWESQGVSGTKDACLDYIEKTWTDLRPLSLRKRMDAQRR